MLNYDDVQKIDEMHDEITYNFNHKQVSKKDIRLFIDTCKKVCPLISHGKSMYMSFKLAYLMVKLYVKGVETDGEKFIKIVEEVMV